MRVPSCLPDETPAASKFKPANVTDTLRAANDTVAYLAALKQFYAQKITERKNGNYGQPKSFLLTDAYGLDLKVKLTDRVTGGLNTPDVKTMIEEYRRDSL